MMQRQQIRNIGEKKRKFHYTGGDVSKQEAYIDGIKLARNSSNIVWILKGRLMLEMSIAVPRRMLEN